jgi:hypothetical protein
MAASGVNLTFGYGLGHSFPYSTIPVGFPPLISPVVIADYL